MRIRTRLLLAMVGIHCLLSVMVGSVAWALVERAQRRQAEASAASIAHVIAAGGFALNDAVLSRMRALTGQDFLVLADTAPVQPGTVRVAAAGLSGTVIVVNVQTPERAKASRLVLAGTVLLAGVGTLLFALAAWRIARGFAQPLEVLAASARTLASGEWQQAVPEVGVAEVRDLARELEVMRARLVDLTTQLRRQEHLATLGMFTATIAHEVRNPLSAVRLAVQMLGRRHPDEVSIPLIEIELERLDLTVDELLGYAKGMSISPVAVDLRPLAEDVVRLLRRQADHQDVVLVVQGGGQVTADPRRLRQLLLNLVLNGIQALREGGTVTITVADRRLVVADDGPGVAPAVIPQLFTPFVSSRSDGTGLGLSLAQRIAEAHGARLSHEANQPRGARFVLQWGTKQP